MQIRRSWLKEVFRSFAGWRIDLTLGVRMLIRHPALSAIAAFGIAAAIAIAATMLTVIGEQLGSSTLPLPQGERIVALQKWHPANSELEPLVGQDLLAWREQLSTVRDIGAFRTATKNLILPAAVPEPVQVAEMSAAGFDVAGVAPIMGRVIRPDDERAAAPPVVVIGHAEWQNRFGGHAGVINTPVQLGDTHYTVIGVMPEGFAFPIRHAYWTPLRLDSSAEAIGGGPSLSAFGRLAPGATLQGAQTEVTAVGIGTRTGSPGPQPDARARVVPYTAQFSEMDRPGNKLALQVMRFFVALLLVVVSVNVAVLVYARTAARQGEIAVRTALGASRGRIVAQLFTEGLVLAGLGAVGGVTIATVALTYVRETLSQSELLPFWVQFEISAQTTVSIVVLTVAAAAVIGVLPAWKATAPRILHRLQALAAGGGAGMQLGRVWTTLILLQVAFAVALLPAVVARMSELARDGSQSGFAAHEYVVAQLAMEPPTAAQAAADHVQVLAMRYREIEQRISASGAARGSTFSSSAPGFEPAATLRSDAGAPEADVRVNRVAVNFFDTFGVSVLAGRDFVSADAAPDSRAVIVNRSFAGLATPDGAILGSRVRVAAPTSGALGITGLEDDWYQVVGVVEDFPVPASGKLEPRLYRAATPEKARELTIALHLHAADTQSWGGRLRQMAADVDPALQVTNVRRMDDLFGQQQRASRLLAAALAAMTLSVLLLSAAGIYAMTAFSVTQRRREIGIRLALGAGARRLLWTMFSRTAAQLLGGAVLGTAVAVLLNRAASGEIMSVQMAAAIGVVGLLMTIAGLLAALGPAREGLRIQPTEALRDR